MAGMQARQARATILHYQATSIKTSVTAFF
jgi:hypothetical protein